MRTRSCEESAQRRVALASESTTGVSGASSVTKSATVVHEQVHAVPRPSPVTEACEPQGACGGATELGLGRVKGRLC